MMRIQYAFAGAVAAALCSASGQAKPLPDLETRVWHSSTCTKTDVTSGDEALPGTFLLSLLAPLVNTVVKGVGSDLSKAGEPEETRLSGTAATAFYKGVFSPDGSEVALLRQAPCFNVVVDSASMPPRETFKLDGDNVGPDGKAFLASHGFARAPRLYMESRIIVSPDRSAWRLVPVRAFIGEPLSSKSRARDLVVTTSVHAPAAQPDGDVLATRSVAFRRAAQNAPIARDVLNQLATSWMPLPALSDDARARVTAALQRQTDLKALNESIAAGKVKGKQLADANKSMTRLTELLAKDTKFLEALAPVTLKVDVLQTVDGNKALAAIGNFISENSEAISKPIADELNPETRRQNRLTEAAAEDDVRIAAIEAVQTWQTTIADASKTAAEKRISEIRAQAACRKLRSEGFEDVACLGVLP